MHIQQAIYGAQDQGGYHFLGRSAGFVEDWLGVAERLCTGFGDRPAGATCPLAIFAQPFGRDNVAVVQVADQGHDDAGRPGALAFRLLIVPLRLYHGLDSDPFLLSDRFPPDWAARGELSVVEWAGGPPARRTVADLKTILDVAPDVTATLLGGVQVLIDGGRLVFERQAPAPELIRGLWALLPSSNRAEMWPATFAFRNAHGFHVVALPDRKAPELQGYANGDEAGDYPEGRYEYAIQKAVEDEDQSALDGLLARSSRGQMIRLALVLLAALVVGVVLFRVPLGPRQKQEPPEKKKGEPGKEKTMGEKALLLPADHELPGLGDQERRDLAKRLAQLADRVGTVPPEGTGDIDLGLALLELDRGIDAALGEARRGLLDRGPPRRQLMALAWKHGVTEYADVRLNAVELLERLEANLARAGSFKERKP